MTEVTLLTAFIAGIFSISSPCCLPLIPIFLSHIAGSSAGQSAPRTRGVVLRHAAAYVAGFSLVFIALGVALGAVGVFAGSLDFISQNRFWMVRIGGVLLVLLGLQQLGWISVPFLKSNTTSRSFQRDTWLAPIVIPGWPLVWRGLVPLCRSDSRRDPDDGRWPTKHRAGHVASHRILTGNGHTLHVGRVRRGNGSRDHPLAQ